MHALTVELLRKSYGAQEVVKGISFRTDWEKVEARCSRALLGGGGAARPIRV